MNIEFWGGPYDGQLQAVQDPSPVLVWEWVQPGVARLAGTYSAGTGPRRGKMIWTEAAKEAKP